MKDLLYLAIALTVLGCQHSSYGLHAGESEKPNILWLVAEGLSPCIPPFGDSTVQTPNLSRLTEEGVRYHRL